MKSIKIAVITDVHANLIALKEVLDIILNQKYDYIFNLGDSIAIGPYPKETIDLLLSHNIIMLLGNHEYYYLNDKEKIKQIVGEGEYNHQLWVKSVLGTEYKSIIERFPLKLEKAFFENDVEFQHYPINISKEFKPVCNEPTPKALNKLFNEPKNKLILYGHHHKYNDTFNYIQKTRFVNPGSLGCSRDNYARYCAVEFYKEGYNISIHKVEYDKQKVIKAMFERKVPEREFVCKNFYGC